MSIAKKTLLKLGDGGETSMGTGGVEGRIAEDVVVLRPPSNRIEARSRADGSIEWELEVGEKEMISSVFGNRLRLDTGRLYAGADSPAFFQYIDSRVVDVGRVGNRRRTR